MNYLLRSRQGMYCYYDDKKDKVIKIAIADFDAKKNTDIDGVWFCGDKSYARQIPQSFFQLFADTYHIPEIKKRDFTAEKRYLQFACRRIEAGKSLSDIRELYDKAPELIGKERQKRIKRITKQKEGGVYRKDGTEIDYITGVHNPHMERETDNTDTKTFDFIRLEYSLKSKLTMPQDELMKAVRADIKDILVHAYKKIENAYVFQKYNVSVNLLKCSRCMVTSDRMLQLTFELKTRNLDMENEKDMEEEDMER